METADMGGSDPNVIKELQQADQNPFPERHFDGKSDDPLENLKNKVRQLRVSLSPPRSKPQLSFV